MQSCKLSQITRSKRRMSAHLLTHSLLVLVTVALATQLVFNQIQAAQQGPIEKAKRHNIMDPIYAYDDIEIYTPGSRGDGRQQVAASSTTTTTTTTTATNNKNSGTNNNQSPSKKPSVGSSLTSSSNKDLMLASQMQQSYQRRSINASTTTQSPAEKNKDLIDEDERPAHLQPSTTSTTTTTAFPKITINRTGGGSNSGSLSQSDFLEAIINQAPGNATSPPIVTKKKEAEQPATHWSALNNYYEKLRQQSLLRQQQQPLPMFPPTQQVQETDDSLFGTKGAIYQLSQLNQLSNYNSQRQPPVHAPIWTSSHSNTNINNQHQSSSPSSGKTSPFLLDLGNQQQRPINVDQDFAQLFANRGNADSGIGGSSILMRPTKSQQQQQQVDQLEWRKLPDLLYLQQQQRAKSQQSQVCSWYDRQINEILRAMAENGCGRSSLAKS